MKKYIIALFAVLLLAGTALAVTPGYQQNPGTGDILGQGKLQSDAHKIFRMVRYIPPTYSGASAAAADSIVIWSLASDDGITVTTTTTSGDSAVAGIIVVQALTPDTDGNTAVQDRGKVNWTWLQTYGLSQTNLATGDNLNDSGWAMGTGTVAGESAPFAGESNNPKNQGIAGFYYDVGTAGDDDVEVFLNID